MLAECKVSLHVFLDVHFLDLNPSTFIHSMLILGWRWRVWRRRKCGRLLRLFSLRHAADAAHDAAKRPLPFLVREEDLAHSCRAVIPALQDCQVLRTQIGRASCRERV